VTEIGFYTGVDDVLVYACRLLRKAVGKGARVVACAEAELLAQLDRALWTFDALDFTPHLRIEGGAKPPGRFAVTPIWLVDRDDAASLHASPVHEVLLNLGPDPVPGFESFERVLEIVGRDEAAVSAGRRRWRHYAERGYAVEHHQAG
jgi:DNA polymerase-3 subunit chi